MDEPNQFNLTWEQLNYVRLTGSIVSTLCLAVITLILLLLIFYKTHTSTMQRLLLYLTIIAVIQEVWVTAGYTTQFEYSGHEVFCDMINIVWQWSTTVGYLLTLVMIVYLPYISTVQERSISQTFKIKMLSCNLGVPLHLHCVGAPTHLHLAIGPLYFLYNTTRLHSVINEIHRR